MQSVCAVRLVTSQMDGEKLHRKSLLLCKFKGMRRIVKQSLLLAMYVLGFCTAACSASPTPTPIRSRIDVVITSSGLKVFSGVIVTGDSEILLNILNITNEAHEVDVAESTLTPDKLPTDAYGRVDASKLKIVASTSLVQPNATAQIVIKINSGHYVLFSNLQDDYKNGIYADLVILRPF